MPFDHDDPYVEVTVEIISTTDRAVRVKTDISDKIWIPRSCLHGAQERMIGSYIGADIILKVRRWFASKEGLI